VSNEEDFELENDVVDEDEVFFGEMNFEDFDVGFDKDCDSEELEEDLVDFLSLDFIMNSLDLEDAKDFDVGDLEQSVGGMSFERKDNGVSYKIFDNLGELYTFEIYESSADEEISGKYDDFSDFEDFSDFNERNRGGRSMLEIAGFRDFDMEKKRERKRREFW
jgi:hypothetical protein